jgi:zinc transport system ATP-binding protein
MTSPIASPIIKFTDVDFAYEDGITVLKDVNLSVASGDFACIVGPNGGGKTTFIKLILGLIKPSRGKIEVFGDKPAAALSSIGYVPQVAKFDSSFPVSVMEVVLMGCLNNSFSWGRYTKAQKNNAKEALEVVGAADIASKGFCEISGGQRQRVLLARALVSQPKLLLLDEPTANVDVHGTDRLYELFENLNKKFSIMIVSHDIGFVSKKVKSVICIRQTLQIHPTSELTGEVLQKIYGLDVHIIRHDHRCSEEGHSCPHS